MNLMDGMMRNKEYNTSYLIGGVKLIIHEASDDAGLVNRLITQEHQLVFFPMYKKKEHQLCKSRNWRHYIVKLTFSETQQIRMVFLFCRTPFPVASCGLVSTHKDHDLWPSY